MYYTRFLEDEPTWPAEAYRLSSSVTFIYVDYTNAETEGVQFTGRMNEKVRRDDSLPMRKSDDSLWIARSLQNL